MVDTLESASSTLLSLLSADIDADKQRVKRAQHTVVVHSSSVLRTYSLSAQLLLCSPLCCFSSAWLAVMCEEWARFEITNVFCDVITRHKHRLCVRHKRPCDVVSICEGW
jgi:hypothetical protein